MRQPAIETSVTQCHAYISAPTREEVVKKWGRIRLVYPPPGIEAKDVDGEMVRHSLDTDAFEIHFVGHPTVVKHALELAEGS